MVCLRNICINTLHKGDDDDDYYYYYYYYYDDNNNNNNNHHRPVTSDIMMIMVIPYLRNIGYSSVNSSVGDVCFYVACFSKQL
jgi:hypothetical protein